jgi:hypothetical protein
MTKSIKILVDDEIITAVLLEKDAPEACKKIWSSLPLSGTINHVKMAGNELLFMTSIFLNKKENITFEHKAGNISYWPLRQCLVFLYEDYESYSGTFLIAEIIDNLEGLKRVGKKCWIKQGSKMTIVKDSIKND